MTWPKEKGMEPKEKKRARDEPSEIRTITPNPLTENTPVSGKTGDALTRDVWAVIDRHENNSSGNAANSSLS